MVFTTLWSASIALADEEGLVGRIEALPADGLVGAWQVAGFSFVTSGATEFRRDKGPFVLGACVEVEYATVAAQAVATKVATKNNDDCRRTGTPTVTAVPSETTTPDSTVTTTTTPEPSATHGDDDGFRVLAKIDALPEGTWRGIWTIGGRQYAVGEQSRLRQADGPFREGACVEVRYQGTAEPFAVLRLETERTSKCQPAVTSTPGSTIPAPTTTPQPSRTPGDDNDDDDTEIYGTLDSFPAELIGVWVIAGEPYTATTATEFEQKRGLFAVGSCVKAHLFARDPSLIREVETTNGYRCGGSESGGQARGELYGVIQEFPAALIGDWQIGGITFAADAATEFKQRGAPFAQGVTVKVHFVVLADGTLYATEIETKFANDHHGDDHNGNDIFEGAEGHAYGLIERFPVDLLGKWMVAGITYTVTSDTQIVQPHSDFAVGRLVRIKYRNDGDGNRIARQIKTTRGNGGASHESHATLYGFVNEMPASGFVGEWLVDGASFQATALTKFKEEHGLLGLGSYVKMEYRTIGDQNVLHEIEVQVPPGAGEDSTMGEIEAMVDDSDSRQAATAAFATAETWTISGQPYVVTAATDLNDFQGALTVGQQAFVNSYTAADGTEVATQIRGVTLAYELFLPAVNK
jgi:hypothetical protein